jgi:hypothetical protein
MLPSSVIPQTMDAGFGPGSQGWMKPIPEKDTPRFAAKVEVASRAASATTPSTNNPFLIRTPFPIAGPAGGNTPKPPVTDLAWLKVLTRVSIASSRP